jgi:hypothetical protein
VLAYLPSIAAAPIFTSSPKTPMRRRLLFSAPTLAAQLGFWLSPGPAWMHPALTTPPSELQREAATAVGRSVVCKTLMRSPYGPNSLVMSPIWSRKVTSTKDVTLGDPTLAL